MYKSKLYQLCQKRAWSLPEYNISRSGPDHNLRFRANVLVNGVKFNANDLSRSSKEAQNKASQVALEHFASSIPELLPPSTGAGRSSLHFKNHLHEYALKKFSTPPRYAYSCEGPKHALIFKAEVTVGGKTFQGTNVSTTLKEAEHDAAKTALMLMTADETNNAKDHSVSYKTLLNDFVQRENISMPCYKTASNGVDGFSSIVDVGNSSFFGDVAKSEKQAENNAAKVAWLKLNEGRGDDSLDDSTIGHGSKMENTTAGQEWQLVEVKSYPRKRKCPLVEDEVRKSDIFDMSKELKFGEEAEALEEELWKHKNLSTMQELKRKNLKTETMELIMKETRKSN